MSQEYGGGLNPGFSSPPIVLQCDVRYSSTSPPSHAQDDTKRSKASRLRSNEGCRTCRQRKVKCDEAHPRCGPCTRLNRDCVWGRQWRFQNDTVRVERKYTVVGTLPDRTRGSGLELAVNANSLPPFSALPDDSYREQKALTRAPGTFNVVLTPNSFARLPEYAAKSKKSRNNSSNSWHESNLRNDDDRDDPDIIILSEFENTPYVKLTPANSDHPLFMDSSKANVLFQVSYIPEIQRDFTNYGTRGEENTKHLTLYKNSILKRILPLGTKFNLNLGAGNEDVVIAMAKNFPPLFHAVCSVVMLTLALQGQSDLLTGAFRHYDQAISACLEYTDIDSDEFFYLHFLLLLYDICCATQNWPQDRQMWAQHLHHLSRIVHKRRPGDVVSRLKAYVSWYILFLDAQSCLGGNEEAGSYVRAYLDNGSSIPRWPLSPSAPRKTIVVNEDSEFMAVHGLVLRLFTISAELSQLAQGMRQTSRQPDVAISDLEDQVDIFYNKMRNEWLTRCPNMMRPDTHSAMPKNLPLIARSTFEFAQLQYSVSAIYLHTSMYPGQRLVSARNREEDAYHCSSILSMASKAIANKDTSNHHMVPAIFIAGFATQSQHEKVLAMELLQAMEGTGISRSVSRSLELLRLVVNEQMARQAAGGLAEEVDWIDIAQQRGIKCINFGL